MLPLLVVIRRQDVRAAGLVARAAARGQAGRDCARLESYAASESSARWKTSLAVGVARARARGMRRTGSARTYSMAGPVYMTFYPGTCGRLGTRPEHATRDHTASARHASELVAAASASVVVSVVVMVRLRPPPPLPSPPRSRSSKEEEPTARRTAKLRDQRARLCLDTCSGTLGATVGDF